VVFVSFYRLLPIAILSLGTFVQGQASDPTVTRSIEEANTALKAGNDPDAARACAAALRLAPLNVGAQACAATLKNKVPMLAAAGTALLAAGDAEKALEWCRSALFLNPDNGDAQKCTSAAGSRIMARAREQVQLKQAAGLINRGDVTQATKLLTEIAASDLPAHLSQAHDLQDLLNSKSIAQVDAAKRADIERARALISEGKRSDAATLLIGVAGSTASQDVVKEALAVLPGTASSWFTDFRDSLRTPWIMQVLAGLIIVGGMWIALHWTRDAWRWADRTWRKRTSWKFAGMTEDTVVAHDAILDAIRRVPGEVARPVWTPTRLLLYPGAAGWDVWEDFAIESLEKAKPVHEPGFEILLNDDNPDKALAMAFQNLQFNVGSVGIAGVAQFWTALVEWWRTGEPALSGAAHEVTMGDQTKHVAIRLTAAGCRQGTVSVLASTERLEGVDAVSLSAERAAYKLLSRLGMHDDSAPQRNSAQQKHAPQQKDSPQQIDGHAAFRQGVTSMASCLRSLVDAESAREHRNAALVKTIANLEFARQTFSGDSDHRVYYLEATRLQAIAFACIGRDAAARKLLEDVQDAIPTITSGRDRQLLAEAGYNQAMLHWKEARTPGTAQGAAFMASSLFEQVAAEGDDALKNVVHVWQLADLADLTRREWLALDGDEARNRIQDAARLLETIDAAANNAKASDKRPYALLASRARRSFATAQLRFIAAFELPSRGPFANGDRALPASLCDIVRSSLDSFNRTAQLGPLPSDVLGVRAYGLLLQSQWIDAEEAARQAIAANKADQFALYVAAEAALQRQDLPTARKYLQEIQPAPVIDPALVDLIKGLPPDLTT
jgi:tetratricopeptide (TPR) repeat protein